MKQHFKLVTVAAALAMSFGAQADVVDLFSTPQATLIDTTVADGGWSSSVLDAGPGTTILGGERDLFVELLTRSPAAPSSNASVGVGGGALTFNVGSLATGTATVQWDGVDNSSTLDPTGLGGAPLGGSAFRLDTLFSDQGFEFTIEAYTDGDTFTKLTLLSSNIAAPTTTFIPFAAFSDCGFSGGPVVSTICGSDGAVDFSSLGALQVLIDPNGGTISVDLTLDNVTTVPEPASLALVGLALLGASAAMRRRKA